MTFFLLAQLSLCIAAALPQVVHDAHKKVLEARDPNSPGGSSLTPMEVVQVGGVILQDLGEVLLPQLAKAHGVDLGALIHPALEPTTCPLETPSTFPPGLCPSGLLPETPIPGQSPRLPEGDSNV